MECTGFDMKSNSQWEGERDCVASSAAPAVGPSMLKSLQDELQPFFGNSFEQVSFASTKTRNAGATELGRANDIVTPGSTDGVPAEIWQHIFSLALSETMGGNYHRSLNVLRRVSKRWNQTAISHCSLWTHLPSIPFHYHNFPLRPSTHDAINRRLQLYLARPGALPLTFLFEYVHCHVPEWEVNFNQALKTLCILTDVSNRWGEVEFQVPMELFQELWRIQGRLAQLSKLTFKRRMSDYYTPEANRIDATFFSDAPNLKCITIDTLSPCPVMDLIADDTIFEFNFPWRQLEVFEVQLCTDDSWSNILSESTHLKTLKYTSNKLSTLLSIRITLRYLTKFSLCLGRITENEFLSQLDDLTLPSLADLEIQGTSSSKFYTSLLGLVRRSTCSLQKLTVDPNCDVGVQLDAIIRLLTISPRLTDLDTGYLPERGFKVLTLDSTSLLTIDTAPELRVLTLRTRAADAYTDRVLDPTPLMKMALSRTEYRRPRFIERKHLRLQEVRFVHDAECNRLKHLSFSEDAMRWLNNRPYDHDRAFLEAALRWRRVLLEEFCPGWHPPVAYSNGGGPRKDGPVI